MSDHKFQTKLKQKAHTQKVLSRRQRRIASYAVNPNPHLSSLECIVFSSRPNWGYETFVYPLDPVHVRPPETPEAMRMMGLESLVCL